MLYLQIILRRILINHGEKHTTIYIFFGNNDTQLMFCSKIHP